MFIEQLDSTRLLITLENEDLGVFDLNPKTVLNEDKNTKKLFKQILTLAAVKTENKKKNKSVSIELMPYDNGCFLLATINTKKRKIYKIKKNDSYLLAEFNSTGDVLRSIKLLHTKGLSHYSCCLYTDSKRYYLFFTSKASIPTDLKIILSEFGKIRSCTLVTKSKLNESCKLLHGENSIAYIGSML